MHALAGAREIPRSLPLPDILERRAPVLMPAVDRRLAHRIGQRADLAPGQQPEADRRVGWAEGGGADARNVRVHDLRQDRETGDVAGLALVGAHAHGGVALEMLGRAVALAHGERHVGDGDIVLEVDEVLGAAAPDDRGGDDPERPQGRLLLRRRFRRPARPAFPGKAGLGGGFEPGLEAPSQTVGKSERAGGGAHRALGLSRAVGDKAGQRVVVAELAARLGEQVDRRVPAPRDAHQVAPHPSRLADHPIAGLIEAHDLDRGDPPVAVGGDHRLAAQDLDAALTRPRWQRTLGLGPRVDDGGHLDAGLGQVERRQVGAVVVGEHHRAGARLGRVAVDIGPGRRSEHDAGPVVVGEDERALY